MKLKIDGKVYLQKYDFEGNSLIIPASYENKEEFCDDLLVFQDKEYMKYDRYNEQNPDKQIYAKELRRSGRRLLR